VAAFEAVSSGTPDVLVMINVGALLMLVVLTPLDGELIRYR
jgi:hypothetical protein